MNNAFLFPGQGAQKPKMAKEFYDLYESARGVFQEADEILSMNLSKVIFQGDENDLRRTDICQPAIFVTSMAILSVIRNQFPDLLPSMCGGLSLGEFSALAASGKITFQDLLPIVAARGRYMHEATEKVSTTMVAVIGLEEQEIRDAGYLVSNINSPSQVVIGLMCSELEKAKEELKNRGAKRVIPLDVAGAFHTPYMEKAKEKLSFMLANMELKDTAVELVMNVVGHFVYDHDEIRELLIKQVSSTTRWQDCIVTMDDRSPTCYYEIGPSQLAAMNKKIGVSAPTVVIEHVKDLEAIHESVNV